MSERFSPDRNVPLGLALGFLALAGLCLWQPVRNPAVTKFALAMVSERPAEPIEVGDWPAAESDWSSFFTTGGGWPEIVENAGRRFPRRGVEVLEIQPARSPERRITDVLAGKGVCSDWTEAVMMLCRFGRLKCREWAIVPYLGSEAVGHSAVDFWLAGRARWAMLDVYIGFWATGEGGEPISTPEFVGAMRRNGAEAAIQRLAGRHPSDAWIRSTYGPGPSQLVEVIRNDPVLLSRHWSRDIEIVAKPIGQLLQLALGIGPLYLVRSDPEHRRLKREMQRIRLQTLIGITCAFAAFVLLVVAVGAGSGRSSRRSDEAADRAR